VKCLGNIKVAWAFFHVAVQQKMRCGLTRLQNTCVVVAGEMAYVSEVKLLVD
jgi:hypothetical protein